MVHNKCTIIITLSIVDLSLGKTGNEGVGGPGGRGTAPCGIGVGAV